MEHPEPVSRLWINRATPSSSHGFAVIGISGIGKTSAINASLDQYPQVILHSAYHARALPRLQVVYLKLDCPHDGSVRGLCINFFYAIDALLGTDYMRLYVKGHVTIDSLIPAMARVAALHGLGLLVIDEVQHLCTSMWARSRESRMLNFFVQLENTVGVPIILVGTYKAQRLLGKELRQARRSAGQGDMIWNPMTNNDVFREFCKALWRYQYVREPTPLNDSLLASMFWESQGITDVVVRLFTLAQIRGIATGIERITPSVIHSVARDSLQLLRPIIKALRERDAVALRQLDDVELPPLDDMVPRMSEEGVKRVPGDRQLDDVELAPLDDMVPKMSEEGVERVPGEDLTASAVDAETAKSPPSELSKRGNRKRRTAAKEESALLESIKPGLRHGESAYVSLRNHGFIRDVVSEISIIGAG